MISRSYPRLAGGLRRPREVRSFREVCTPLSRIRRPEWDVEILSGLGTRVEADHAIWQRVWSRQEKINLASTPMFLVCGSKAAV